MIKNLFSFSKLQLFWFIPLLIVLIAGLVVSKITGIPFGLLSRDPTAILGGHPLVGILSNFGVLMWCFSASVCFFAVFSATEKNSTLVRTSLIYGGMLSSILLFDDLFLVHEELGPKYLGLSESLIYLGYGFIALGYLWLFRKELLAEEPFYLALAFFLFAVSVFVDKATEGAPTLNTFFIEESAKYLGILSWAIFHGRYAAAYVRSRS